MVTLFTYWGEEYGTEAFTTEEKQTGLTSFLAVNFKLLDFGGSVEGLMGAGAGLAVGSFCKFGRNVLRSNRQDNTNITKAGSNHIYLDWWILERSLDRVC